MVSTYSWQELLGTKKDKVCVTQEEISQVFDRYFLSYNAVTTTYSKINNLTETDSTCEAMRSIQGEIQKAQTALVKMELNYELPYNEWLYM